MAIEPGTRFGPYEVVEQIGSGGMGEVWRATDTELGRDVAVKVLPQAFVDDADRLARFKREAEVLASLNHANIATIYGLEKADSQTVIVMELVEGPTLADRIKDGAIPPDEALTIARQITDALEAAHANQIVHRDLKPANVKLKDDGTVKVLDFGISKSIDPQAISGTPASLTPTVTEAGVILGTAAYMSPEQARGRFVDQRTDIWAFGCLLFEMLTGQPAFGGEDIMAILARVIDRDTDLSSMPGTISPAVRHTLKLCLEKDPKRRIADIRDVRLAMAGIFETGLPSAAEDQSSRWRRSLAPAAGVVVGGAFMAVVGWVVWPEREPEPPNLFSYRIPEDQAFRLTNFSLIDIAPDGRSFVYNAADGLHLRAMGELEDRQISGTEENLIAPVFSSDSQSLAYFTADSVKRIATTGGASVEITDFNVNLPPGATWGADDTIVFNVVEGIVRVRATGGAAELIVPAEAGEQFYRPQLLPDGNGVLFTAADPGGNWDAARIVVHSFETNERTVLVSGGSDGRYLSTGHVVYTFEDGLYAIAFDADTLTVSGGAIPLLQGVRRATGLNPAAQFAVSDDGTLVYITGGASTGGSNTLVWVDQNGVEEPFGLGARNFGYARVSPDGTRIAVQMNEQGNNDIWISDVGRPVLSRITSTPTAEMFPMWSPDGRNVVFYSPQAEVGTSLGWTLSDGTGEIEFLVTMPSVGLLSPGSWTPDGEAFVFTYGTGSAQPQIGLLSIEPGDNGERSWEPLIERTTGASAMNISPDGEWVAYHTDDTGQYGVYIERFPDLGDRRLVSDERGGWGAIWSADGSEIFYRRLGDGAMMAVPVQTSPTVSIGASEMLFENRGYWPPATPEAGGGSARNWDLAPDGRFLMIQGGGGVSGGAEIVIVQNWFEELKRLAPTN